MRFVGRMVLVALATLTVAPAFADDIAVGRSLVSQFVMPRVEALAGAAARQEQAWATVCPNPDPAGVSSLTKAFGAAAEAWAAVEILRGGPMSENGRADRMAFWPERKDAVALGLQPLLAGTDPGDLGPDAFRRYPAPVQGLTALEKVLYGGVIDASTAGLRRCAVGLAIARAVSATAIEIKDAWEKPGASLEQILTQGKAMHGLLAQVATDLVTMQDRIATHKIGDVMGRTAADARPERAEMRLSGRSLRQIAANLESMAVLTRLLVDDRGDAGVNTISAADTAADIARSLAQAWRLELVVKDPKGREHLSLLVDSVRSANEVARDVVPATLGVSLGAQAGGGN